MSVSFTAIDFETANRSPASVCAVGAVRVRDGAVVARECWLIHPPAGHDWFAPFNIRLHGITPDRVATAPDWCDSLRRLLDFIGADVIVAHNAPFDVGVIVAASQASGIAVPDLRSLCSLRLARKLYRLPSYRLPVAAEAAGFTLKHHHDPLADAEACAAIVIDLARTGRHATLEALSAASGVPIHSLNVADTAALHRIVQTATF